MCDLFLFPEINNSFTKLTVDRLDRKKIKVKRDELHLYIIKPNNSQVFTIHIKVKDLSNKVMAFQSITLHATGWYTIPLNGNLQNWFNSVQLKSQMYLEFKKASSNTSKGHATIGKSSRKQPYLVVYMT